MLPAGSPLSAWLTWLETLSPNEIDLGLERVRDVLDRLDLDFPEHVLIIGGTNGKGSSVAMTGALLQAAGYSVGSYTSPHIVDYNERIAVGGRLASDAEIIAAFEGIEELRPGHYMQVTRSERTISRYWSLDFPPAGKEAQLSEEEAAEQLRELLSDAARLRLRADVTVGSYLSGGLDSTYIAGLIRHHTPESLCTF